VDQTFVETSNISTVPNTWPASTAPPANNTTWPTDAAVKKYLGCDNEAVVFQFPNVTFQCPPLLLNSLNCYQQPHLLLNKSLEVQLHNEFVNCHISSC
jgi:hypothetical protein